ncbi:family 16 glycoside hydrolase [Neorhodopirellula pilleata]|uniref:PhoD-like phosphatase n=1 Tax=Neorhodopirellula pilleata TaxID=2714738 RepID=A0A5C6APN6_9BACT|nr:family 16 glycoside hydrolase [Neorhodopirellula pilleata]TWU01487.1 PhoD-like phosphatase [Neorhodopirellula pilleata]
MSLLNLHRSTLLLTLFTLSTCLYADTADDKQELSSENADWTSRGFWRTDDGDPVPSGWEFTDGQISLVAPRRGGNILSPPLPANFDLSWQWKIEKGVNSGLKYRVRRFEGRYLGLEYQLIDSKPDSTSDSSTAAVYDLVGPARDKTLHPPGQWNQSRIVATGSRITHYLNGDMVASVSTEGPAWETRIALSKFGGEIGFGLPVPGGRVMLTDHGGKVTFRNFQFTEVDAAASEQTLPTGPFLANATRNSWADQNSIVLWTRTTRNPEMLVDGRDFVTLAEQQARKLADEKDPEKLLNLQLPNGASLDEMLGACPGAPGKVRLSYHPVGQHQRIKNTHWITTSAQSDFTAQWKLESLKANSNYVTIVEAQTLDGEPSAVLRGAFRTAPESDEVQDVNFCITTCHDFIRRDDGMNGHKIYPAMSELNPHFVVHAGDIEYYDKPDPWALTKSLMRFKWGRIFALPNNRRFYHHTTSYFIKDDHDTLANDCWPGTTFGSVTFEEGVQLFNEEQFPSRDPRYKSIRWGRDLEIWILEGRDYRSPNHMPDGPEKSILGKEQKAWLFETLASSDAKFKLICSPTPIVGPDRNNKKDNHANDTYAYEGNEIREQLATIPGAIVLCGDRHWQYASVDGETGVWEFGCGPGSEKHQMGWKRGDERPAHQFLRVDGGFLSGRVSHHGNDQETRLTIHHHDVSGKQVSRFVFPIKKD